MQILSLVQRVIQIKNRIIKHVNASEKTIVGAKTVIAGTLAHLFVRIVTI